MQESWQKSDSELKCLLKQSKLKLTWFDNELNPHKHKKQIYKCSGVDQWNKEQVRLINWEAAAWSQEEAASEGGTVLINKKGKCR